MNNNKMMMPAVLLLVSNTAYAEFSSTMTLTSDNVSRGISDTDGAPAIQGSFDYSHASGIHAGLWASNVKFRENANAAAVDTVDEATIEIDYYLGFSAEASAALSWEVAANYMTYPGAEPGLNYNYWEAFGGLCYTLDAVSLSPEFIVELYHSPDYSENSGPASYVVGGVALALPMDFSMFVLAGRQTFKDSPADDYSDVKIGLTKEIAGLQLELAYTDSNISKLDCGGDMCDSRVVFSITTTMQ